MTPPKGPPAASSAAPRPPRKAPPAGGFVPPRPGAPVYKPPPHGAFVAIIGKDPAGVRVRPPPSNLVHPNHRARRAREDWDRNNPPAGAAPGAPDPRPPPLYRAPQRQVADRPKVVVIFDWFGVLSRSWNNILRRFSQVPKASTQRHCEPPGSARRLLASADRSTYGPGGQGQLPASGGVQLLC